MHIEGNKKSQYYAQITANFTLRLNLEVHHMVQGVLELRDRLCPPQRQLFLVFVDALVVQGDVSAFSSLWCT
jgi:hypothetical protein